MTITITQYEHNTLRILRILRIDKDSMESVVNGWRVLGHGFRKGDWSVGRGFIRGAGRSEGSVRSQPVHLLASVRLFTEVTHHFFPKNESLFFAYFAVSHPAYVPSFLLPSMRSPPLILLLSSSLLPLYLCVRSSSSFPASLPVCYPLCLLPFHISYSLSPFMPLRFLPSCPLTSLSFSLCA